MISNKCGWGLAFRHHAPKPLPNYARISISISSLLCKVIEGASGKIHESLTVFAREGSRYCWLDGEKMGRDMLQSSCPSSHLVIGHSLPMLVPRLLHHRQTDTSPNPELRIGWLRNSPTHRQPAGCLVVRYCPDRSLTYC